MKVTIRHLSLVVTVMFLALMLSTSIIQVVAAPQLNADPHNHRTIVRENTANRGSIMVGKEAIAYSVPSKDQYRYLRVYPKGPLYAAVTGYHSPILNSSTGLELYESSTLTGNSDSFLWQRLRTLLDGKESPGGSISLTINPRVQEAGYSAFGNQRGAAVAIDPRTGAILSLLSMPSYDPNQLASHDAQSVTKTAKELEKSAQEPILNRAIHQTYTPGSTFKVVTSTAMIEAGLTPDSIVDAPTRYQLPGSTHWVENYGGEPCGDGSGKTSLTQAIQQSCNTPFAIFGHKIGFAKINKVAHAYGFDQKLNIPMAVLPSTLSSEPDRIDANGSAITAFGQKDVQMTPLQGALITAAVANRGVMMKPYLISTALSSKLDVISQTKPQVMSRPLTPEQAAQMRSMMIEVVRNGTGRRAQIPGVEVAAKSGTAELGPKIAPHAWFFAFAPAQNPVIAVAVIVENSGNAGVNGTGATVAAPIAKAMIEAAIQK